MSFVKDIIDTTIVTPISGSGEIDSPLEMEVQAVTLEKFSEFLNNIKKLNGVLEKKYVDGNFTVYKIKVKNTSLISRFIEAIKNESSNEAYIEIKIPNDLENANALGSKLEEVISKNEGGNTPEDGNKPGDENTSGNSNNNKLPITGKESIISLVGVVTTAAGMLLVGKKKKNKK